MDAIIPLPTIKDVETFSEDYKEYLLSELYSIGKLNTYEAGVAFGANKQIIRKQLLKVNDIRHNDERFIRKAAIWCYRFYGFGKADVYEYLDYLHLRTSQRKFRLRIVDVDHWKEISKTVFKRDNYTCFYCGEVGGKLEADHKLPISKGGGNELENLITSCRKCNRQKYNKTVEQYLEWRNKKGL